MPTVRVTREVAQGVWQDLEKQERPIEVAARHRLSERTVRRLGAAIKGFHNHRPDGEIAMATGWSRRCISELKGYWKVDLAPHPKDVGPRRQAVGSGSRPDQQETLQRWVQLEDVKDLLLGIKLELAPFLTNFPTVWKGFHPDPSNRLKWVGEGDSRRIVWNLEVEQDYRWSPIAEGLQILLHGIASNLQGIKESYTSYCQVLVEQEDGYLERAEGEMLRVGEANLNRSHYYRSTLAEIDREHSMPSEQDYRLDFRPKDEVSGVHEGVLLLQATSEEIARKWIARHILWRSECWGRHQHLAGLRGEVKNGVERLTRTIEELLTSSLYVGRQE